MVPTLPQNTSTTSCRRSRRRRQWISLRSSMPSLIVMRNKIKIFICILTTLSGGCSASPIAEEQMTTRHDDYIATLTKPTDKSELIPYRLDGKLIYYIGRTGQNPQRVSKASFDKIVPDMTIENLVDTLGPGFSLGDAGLAFISWYCEDGRQHHVFTTITELNQVPKVYKYKK